MEIYEANYGNRLMKTNKRFTNKLKEISKLKRLNEEKENQQMAVLKEFIENIDMKINTLCRSNDTNNAN